MTSDTNFAGFFPPTFIIEENSGLPTVYGSGSMATSNPSGVPVTAGVSHVPPVIPPMFVDDNIVAGGISSGGSNEGGKVDKSFAQKLANFLSSPRTSSELSSVGSPNAGLLGIRIPYIAFTFPSAKYPDHYNEHIGRPIETSAPLNSFHGYTVVSAIHLDNVRATLPEKKELESLLMEGVIL